MIYYGAARLGPDLRAAHKARVEKALPGERLERDAELTNAFRETLPEELERAVGPHETAYLDCLDKCEEVYGSS